MRALLPRHAVAAVAVVLSAAGCGGSSPPSTAGARTPRPISCRPPLPRDLAAPGPYAVRTATTALARRASTTNAVRHLDPVVWYPAQPGRSGRGCRFPLILLSHGAAGKPTNYSRLAAHVASEGFVVLGPHHDDRARGDEEVERVADLRFLLAHLASVERRLAPELAGRVDARRIGVAGHSFGAHTVAQLAAQDRRVAAAVVMAGGADDSTAHRIRAATLVLAGAGDHLVPFPHVRGFEQALPPTTPHGLAVIAGAGHTAFSDKCVATKSCAMVQRLATALFLTYLDGRRAADGPLDPSRVDDPRVRLTTVDMPPR